MFSNHIDTVDAGNPLPSISIISLNWLLSIFSFNTNLTNIQNTFGNPVFPTASKIPIPNKLSNIKSKKVKALIVNSRNANCLTGSKGYNSLREIAEETANLLTDKQKSDEDDPKKIKFSDIMFGCTGTIGEPFPIDKIKPSIKKS